MNSEELLINGDVGHLQAHYTKGTINKCALILSPHPMYGGDMENNICRYIYTALSKRGYSTMRLNYRGVGLSEGEFDQSYGEVTDANFAIDWLLNNNIMCDDITVCGFSFGAYIASQITIRRPEVKRLISVSQPFGLYSHEFMTECPKTKSLFIRGSMDDIHGKHATRKDIDINVIDGADHFMTGKLEEMMTIINGWL